MGSVTASVELDQPLQPVWDLFRDPDRWLEWNTELAGMRDVRGPFDQAGAGYTQVWRLGPFEREGRWEVVGCAPGRWRRVAGRTPIGVAFEAREDFEEVPTGTRVTIEIRWPPVGGRLGPLIDRFFGEPILRRALDANAERIRALLATPGTGRA